MAVPVALWVDLNVTQLGSQITLYAAVVRLKSSGLFLLFFFLRGTLCYFVCFWRVVGISHFIVQQLSTPGVETVPCACVLASAKSQSSTIPK